MNKLIIIGNGFDRAHGLNTDYGSFVKWYLLNAIKTLQKGIETVYEDMLIKIHYPGGYKGNYSHDDIENLDLKNVIHFFQHMTEDADKNTYPRNGLKKNIKSYLFLQIYNKVSLNWVDVESEYFNTLKIAYQGKKNREVNIININKEFFFLKEKLIEYLKTQQSQFCIKDFYPLFNADIDKNSEIHILNFNYTYTILNYLPDIKDDVGNMRYTVNFIHGEINNPENQPIFGIGDEHDKNYTLFKNSPFYRELLKYSKSQWYQRSMYHRMLVQFMSEGPFSVEILGHSCGTSDRTLLRYIFEQKHCLCIKPHYYKKKEHCYNLMLDIERLFSEPTMFREKVMPAPMCRIIPQSE